MLAAVLVLGRVNRLMTSLKLSNQGSWQTWSALSLLAAAGFVLGAYSGRKREKLEGRIAWVNGGSRGLGLLVAVEMARRGAKVAVTARDQAELDESRRLLSEFSPDHLAARCDAAKRDQVEAAARQITERFSRIDVLVNCASIIQVGPLQAMGAADFEEAIATNLLGYVYTSLAVLPLMRRNGGTILNVTSIGGIVAVPHLLPYSCAKFAAVGLTEGLQAELRRNGIAVINVIPGLMRTGSPVNAWFKGNAQQEWNWFSIGDSLPLLSIDARRAARRIVSAIEHGDTRVVLGAAAHAADKLHRIAPRLTVNLMALANAFLPAAADEEAAQQPRATLGMELASAVSPSLVTGLMNRAARMYNQYKGRARPSPDHARQAGVGEV